MQTRVSKTTDPVAEFRKSQRLRHLHTLFCRLWPWRPAILSVQAQSTQQQTALQLAKHDLFPVYLLELCTKMADRAGCRVLFGCGAAQIHTIGNSRVLPELQQYPQIVGFK